MMDSNPVNNEEHPGQDHSVATPPEDNEPNVEMPSQADESLVLNIPSTPATPKMEKPSKITVLLCAVGGAPIIKQKKWDVESHQTIGFISNFIRKKLALQKSDSLFFYVNQSFAPSLDQSVQNLFDCFGTDGKLILAYCKTHAWG